MLFQMVFRFWTLFFSLGLKETISEDIRCYNGVGCYSQTEPWVSLTRPFPHPRSPEENNVRFFLLTRRAKLMNTTQLDQFQISTDKEFKPSRSSLQSTGYASRRVMTVFIIHGFAAGIESEWMKQMTFAYLSRLDANVFLVDWGKGAQKANYLQVAANTRVVGDILKKFMNTLIEETFLNPLKIHIIGHSLGAHIAAYAAKNRPHIYRITGLDPAQIGFEGQPAEVRLNQTDAVFIDVLHTNAKPVLGLGYREPLGDVDFYFNKIFDQPGCFVEPFFQLAPRLNITSPADIPKLPVETIASLLSCSHSRSIEYFIEAIGRTDCIMWGQKNFFTVDRFLRMASQNIPILSFPLTRTFRSVCNDIETCSPVGLETFLYPARGVFHVITRPLKPYCVVDAESI